MQVSPINNTNFSGKLKKTPSLYSLIKNSDRDTLIKFSDVIKRAHKVNDGKIFSIGSTIDYTTSNINGNHLHEYFIKQESRQNTKLIHSYSFLENPFDSSEKLTENYSSALNSFINKLKEIYPEKPRSKKEIISEIEKHLV